MLILGIDPALVDTGLAILDTDLHRITYTHTLKPSIKKNLQDRLHEIYHTIRRLIYQTEVDHAAIETQYAGRYHLSALKVSMAFGACLVACADCKIPIGQYSPACIKRNFTGIGTADKIMMIQQARQLYPDLDEIDSHIADAVAVAHIHQHFL